MMASPIGTASTHAPSGSRAAGRRGAACRRLGGAAAGRAGPAPAGTTAVPALAVRRGATATAGDAVPGRRGSGRRRGGAGRPASSGAARRSAPGGGARRAAAAGARRSRRRDLEDLSALLASEGVGRERRRGCFLVPQFGHWRASGHLRPPRRRGPDCCRARTRRARAPAASIVEQATRGLQPAGEVVGEPGDDERRGRVQERRCRGSGRGRRRARRAPRRRCGPRRRRRARPARRAARPSAAGSTSNREIVAVAQLVDGRRGGGGELVEPVVTVEDPGPLDAELGERADRRARPSPGRTRRRCGGRRPPGSRAGRGS